MTDRKKGILARLALFGAAIVWGSSFFVVKGAVDFLPPALLQAVRFGAGALLLCAVFPKQLRRLTQRDWAKGFLIGACLAVATLIQNIGIQYTTPGKSAFLTTVYCVLVPFLFWIVRGEKPTPKRFIAAFFCFCGIALVSLDGTLLMGKGDLLTLVSGLLYALHIVLIASLGKTMDPVGLTVVQTAWAGVLSWIYALIVDGSPAAYNWDIWPQVLYLALFATAGGYLLQIVGQKNTPPAAASLILSLESVFGVLFSVLFYGEQVTVRLGIGFLVIFLSILISEMNWRKRPSLCRKAN
ncbi:MAG: DMT family transporter [Clostridia bacterium]